MRRLGPRVLFVMLLALAPATAPAQQPSSATDGEAAYYFMLGRRLESLDKVTEAIAALRHAMTLAPTSAEIRAELAALYARQDKPIEALNYAEEALKYDPNNREANRILGMIFGVLSEQPQALRAGDDPTQYQTRAIAALEKARGDGSDLNVLLALGRLQIRAGQFEKATASLRRVVEEQPQFTEGAMLMATAQEGLGQLADASATLEVAVAVNPRANRALVRLTELYERQHRLQPDNPSILGNLGWAFLRRGDLASADKPLTEAAAQLPSSSAVQDHLGDLRYRQARYAEAVAAWERALAGDAEARVRAGIEKKLQDARARLMRK